MPITIAGHKAGFRFSAIAKVTIMRLSTTSFVAITIAGLVSCASCARDTPSAGWALGMARPNATRELNNRPLIGVLSQPGDPAPINYSYIAASYIKFVEMGGARAVPIPYDAPAEEVRRLFAAINGVIIPGGGQDLSPHHPFYDTTALLLQLTMAANNRGDFFPLHGTCLGFEALALIISGNMSILSAFNSEDNASPLLLTEDGLRESSFFGSFPARLLANVQDEALAMENHNWGLDLNTFYTDEGLWSYFTVTSLSIDRDGVKYISTLEAKHYPVTATQWHPEKNAFEFPRKLHIPHSSEAVELTHAVSKFLVDQARRSSHTPRSVEEEQEMLIYNYVPIYTGKGSKIHPGTESDFDQAYFFAPYHQKAASLR